MCFVCGVLCSCCLWIVGCIFYLCWLNVCWVLSVLLPGGLVDGLSMKVDRTHGGLVAECSLNVHREGWLLNVD